MSLRLTRLQGNRYWSTCSIPTDGLISRRGKHTFSISSMSLSARVLNRIVYYRPTLMIWLRTDAFAVQKITNVSQICLCGVSSVNSTPLSRACLPPEYIRFRQVQTFWFNCELNSAKSIRIVLTFSKRNGMMRANLFSRKHEKPNLSRKLPRFEWQISEVELGGRLSAEMTVDEAMTFRWEFQSRKFMKVTHKRWII